MKKSWYRSIKLSKDAIYAKSLLLKLCRILSIEGKREFYLEMNACNNIYEGHIIDAGKCFFDSSVADDWVYDPNGKEEIGMVFFGGYFSRKKHKDAVSKAWISLLEDCIGIGELKDQHTLTQNLESFGPKLNLNFSSFREFEVWATDKLNELEKRND